MKGMLLTFMLSKSLSARYAGTFFTHLTRWNKLKLTQQTYLGFLNLKNKMEHPSWIPRGPQFNQRHQCHSHLQPPEAPRGFRTFHSRCSPAKSFCLCSCIPLELCKRKNGCYVTDFYHVTDSPISVPTGRTISCTSTSRQ